MLRCSGVSVLVPVRDLSVPKQRRDWRRAECSIHIPPHHTPHGLGWMRRGPIRALEPCRERISDRMFAYEYLLSS